MLEGENALSANLPSPREVLDHLPGHFLPEKAGDARATVHLELTAHREKRGCISIKLTDKSKKEQTAFDAALFRGDECIESVHVGKNTVASFSGISPGDYVVKVYDKKGEIASASIRLEG